MGLADQVMRLRFPFVSRRSRRGKRRGRGGGAGGGWLVRVVITIIVMVIGGAAVGYGLIRNYLHSDSFRSLLGKQVSEAAGVTGAFSPLRWEGLAARSGGFVAEGDGPVLAIRADDLRTEIGLQGLRDGYWLLRGSGVRYLEFTVDARRSDDAPAPPATVISSTPAPPAPPAPYAAKKGRWLPRELRFDELDVQNLAATVLLDDGPLDVRGPRIRARGVAGTSAIDIEARGGTIRPPMPWLPEFRLDAANARYRDDTVFLTDARFRMYDTGVLDATGEWDVGSGDFALQGSADGIDCSDLLGEDWARRITGRVAVNYSLVKSGDDTRAQGRIEVRDGVVTALPLLDVLAAYADTRRFRMLTVHEAQADWEWSAGRLTLRNLRLASEGLVRLEGGLTIDRDGALDGDFRLGLAPGTLSTIPGAETEVFRSGERGLLWTPLRVSGTLDNPKEDLTDRLIAAAGSRMFEILPETGERVLKFTRSLLGESPPRAIERGLDVIERGTEIIEEAGPMIREASGLLDGLLRGRRRGRDPTPAPNPSATENGEERR